jgi:hypothetical protein
MVLAVAVGVMSLVVAGGSALASQGGGAFKPAARGELDCNGFSPVQKVLRAMNCTDIRGIEGVDNRNTWSGKFYDNGTYIGHDEPDATYLSSDPGSGGNVNWTITLGRDPKAAPGDAHPGKDVSHWFELTPAPWLSMAICDSNSYPQLPCAPRSDANAPACRMAFNCKPNSYPGAGSAFMEMQFYPPGNAPFIDSESCDATHWCAALTIDSLECTFDYAQCNPNCEEPVNFAFVQRNGVPTGPPAPQDADTDTFVPNGQTLLMNPGDKVAVHMWDAPAQGGGDAIEVDIHDRTTGQTGRMQASAKNGFQDTSILDCSGTPFNFEPEYNTASYRNIIPWAALQTDISTEFETGHFEPCTSLSEPLTPNPEDPSDTGGTYNECHGPYEKAGGKEGAEVGDALCYAKGDTHPGYAGPGTRTAPVLISHCQDDWFQNGDLDFDGTPYWKEWPTSTHTSSYPSSFVEQRPASGGHSYSRWFIQTDIALSESSCTYTTQSGCTVPPSGPGHFYPYWSLAHSGGSCVLEFGNVSAGVNDLGKDHEYGTDLFDKIGYPEFEQSPRANTC